MSATVPSDSMTVNTLKEKSDIHLARKIWHFSGVILIVVIYHNVSRAMALQLMTFFGSLIIFMDVFRQYSPTANKILMKTFGPLMRKYEADGLTGTSYMMLGVFIAIAFFPTDVCKLALFFLATADPIASYFGIRFGRDRLFGNKSLQGTMAAFTVCLIVSFVYYVSKGLMLEKLLMVSVLSALAGAISEVIPVGKLDDNLVLPVLSASMLYGIFYLFGGL